MTVVALIVYASVAAHFQPQPTAALGDLLARGESDRVEFKSTARVNLRTGARDERMEQVIAKTLDGFLNGDGGTLLIGGDDTGTPLGLAADFATLKSPDIDRFELWLRDLVTTTMGQNAAALVGVHFEEAPDTAGLPAVVCRVTCTPSPTPVYLRPKGASRNCGCARATRRGS